jgi:hypothetical protein
MRRVFILLLLVGLFGCESPGRYQLVMGADDMERTATYLVDTQTGRVWRKHLPEEYARFFPIPFHLDEGNLSALNAFSADFDLEDHSYTPSNTWADFWKNRKLKKTLTENKKRMESQMKSK